MAKKNRTPFSIFTESVGLYFSNFKQFVKYMSFPVLGQIFGLVLVFLITYFYTQNLPHIIEKFPALNNYSALILASVLVTLPGLVIFIKAFWEYLVAYGAINSMLENMLKSGRVYDFEAHTQLIKRRTPSFIGLWMLFGIFSIVAVCPLFWVICGILAIYFVLVFQVFTYEPELSPIGCVKKSLQLVKGHFGLTFFLFALVGILTYIIIPQIFLKLSGISGIDAFLAKGVLPFVNVLPQINFEQYGITGLTNEVISILMVQTFIAQIFIQYTLPMRSILWGMWYKELVKTLPQKKEKKARKSSKNPSDKLMEESHKKFGTKKLDRNIIKRAMEKGEE